MISLRNQADSPIVCTGTIIDAGSQGARSGIYMLINPVNIRLNSDQTVSANPEASKSYFAYGMLFKNQKRLLNPNFVAVSDISKNPKPPNETESCDLERTPFAHVLYYLAIKDSI